MSPVHTSILTRVQHQSAAPSSSSTLHIVLQVQKNGDLLTHGHASEAVPKEVLRVRALSRELKDLSTIELNEVFNVRRKLLRGQVTSQYALSASTKVQKDGELQIMPRSRAVLRVRALSRELEDLSTNELNEAFNVRRKSRGLVPSHAISASTKLQTDGELQRMPRSRAASPTTEPRGAAFSKRATPRSPLTSAGFSSRSHRGQGSRSTSPLDAKLPSRLVFCDLVNSNA